MAYALYFVSFTENIEALDMKISTVYPAIAVLGIAMLLSGIATGLLGHQEIAGKLVLSSFGVLIFGGILDMAVFSVIDLIKRHWHV